MLDSRIRIVQGDITRHTEEAIVNAANQSLLGGGGVDGAIHRAAGPQLLAECRTLGGCAPGQARITAGYKLPTRWVIHTVGPVWRGGNHGEDETLAQCYWSCFEIAEKHGIRSIAFPAISSGAYGFPPQRAARIALSKTQAYLSVNRSLEWVTFVCFQPSMHQIYLSASEDL